ncbi:MAG: histidine kinase, partial [Cyanobacteria bacterium J06642_11]
VSTGDTDAEFIKRSEDEVGNLTDSFNRMRLSLQMAMKRIERQRGKRGPGGHSNSGDSNWTGSH